MSKFIAALNNLRRFDGMLSNLFWSNAMQAISFCDFFLADILTSMSKVFSDLEQSVCRMVNCQVASIAWFEEDSICESHFIAIPIVLVLPYLFRLFQCLWQHRDTGERTTLLNALNMPLIFLYVGSLHFFNCFTRVFKFSKPSMLSSFLYGKKWVYLWVLGSNLILQCTWTYKLSTHLHHNYLTVFTIADLEIFCRFRWAFFRMENE